MSFEIKYAPNSLTDIVFPDDNAEGVVMNYTAGFTKGANGNLLLYGPPGSGKSCVAEMIAKYVLVNNLAGNLKKLNGGDFDTTNAAAKIAAYVKDVASVDPWGDPCRIILINEIDKMSTDAQGVLQTAMDDHREWCSFVFTTNNIVGVARPIQSRCGGGLYFGQADPGLWLPRATAILNDQGITNFTQDELLKLLRRFGGDVRNILKGLEAMVPKPALRLPPSQFAKLAPVIPFPTPPVPPAPPTP